jgi:hypothetical protein
MAEEVGKAVTISVTTSYLVSRKQLPVCISLRVVAYCTTDAIIAEF